MQVANFLTFALCSVSGDVSVELLNKVSDYFSKSYHINLTIIAFIAISTCLILSFRSDSEEKNTEYNNRKSKRLRSFETQLKKLLQTAEHLSSSDQLKARNLLSKSIEALDALEESLPEEKYQQLEAVEIFSELQSVYNTLLPYAVKNDIGFILTDESNSVYTITNKKTLQSFMGDLIGQLVLNLPAHSLIQGSTGTDPDGKRLFRIFINSTEESYGFQQIKSDIESLMAVDDEHPINWQQKADFHYIENYIGLDAELRLFEHTQDTFSLYLRFEQPASLRNLSVDLEETLHNLSNNDCVIPEDKETFILIVEDYPEVRLYLKRLLSRYFSVLEAEDGVQALKMAQNMMPDLILSDLMMPKMDGLEFCTHIKTNEQTSHIPVVLLTAHPSADTEVKGLQIGADDYIVKPFSAQSLLARISNLINQRRALRQLFSKLPSLEPSKITSTSTDAEFLRRAIACVEDAMDDTKFDTSILATKMNLSRSQLNRKLQAIIAKTSREFIRTLRLNRACQLLEKKVGNVSEVIYMVGYNNLSHFAKVFKQHIGVSPSDYRNGIRPDKNQTSE
ncbi:MAG: response regulator [Calditrichia bacterium]